MPATIRKIAEKPETYQIRFGDNHHKHYDEFEKIVFAQKISEKTVEINGLSGSVDGKTFREIEKLLVDRGFEIGIWERVKDGKIRRIKWNVKKHRLEQ